MRKLLPLCTAVLACSLTPSAAAPITWQAPFNIASDSDIDKTGTLVEAKNACGDSNSQTVNIGGENILFEAIAIAPSNTATGTFFTGGAGDTGNVALNTVLDSHSYSGSDWSFQLAGLTSGADYQIQIIGGGDTRNCCDSRNQRAGDGESPEGISGDFSRSGVGSVVGTFTADGSAQAIRILPGINNGVDPSISGYVLRSVAPPTPQSPTDITLSNTDLAPASAAGTLVGTLATVDPNPGDTHSYSFADSGSFPDNALFSIANDEQLRAASALGSFGSSYTVRLRTTDNGGLSYDETFVLQVEAAVPPSSLNFSATTVLQATPSGGAVGSFSTVDANSADSHGYALVSGSGDTDNALFSINDDSLEVAGLLPGLGAVLSVRVRSTDLSGLSIDGSFALTVVGPRCASTSSWPTTPRTRSPTKMATHRIGSNSTTRMAARSASVAGI